MDEYIIQLANYIVHKYKTRDAFEIVSRRDIDFDYTHCFTHLLGYYCVIDRERFIRINSSSSEQEQRETIQHELGHDVFDYHDAAKGVRFRDAYFYNINSTETKERRANLSPQRRGYRIRMYWVQLAIINI